MARSIEIHLDLDAADGALGGTHRQTAAAVRLVLAQVPRQIRAGDSWGRLWLAGFPGGVVGTWRYQEST